MTTRLIIIPILGAFIGWSTNVLAIKLIFWPYEPVKIPLTKWQVHGVIPKRRREKAANIEVVEEQLFLLMILYPIWKLLRQRIAFLIPHWRLF